MDLKDVMAKLGIFLGAILAVEPFVLQMVPPKYQHVVQAIGGVLGTLSGYFHVSVAQKLSAVSEADKVQS